MVGVIVVIVAIEAIGAMVAIEAMVAIGADATDGVIGVDTTDGAAEWIPLADDPHVVELGGHHVKCRSEIEGQNSNGFKNR